MFLISVPSGNISRPRTQLLALPESTVRRTSKRSWVGYMAISPSTGLPRASLLLLGDSVESQNPANQNSGAISSQRSGHPAPPSQQPVGAVM